MPMKIIPLASPRRDGAISGRTVGAARTIRAPPARPAAKRHAKNHGKLTGKEQAKKAAVAASIMILSVRTVEARAATVRPSNAPTR